MASSFRAFFAAVLLLAAFPLPGGEKTPPALDRVTYEYLFLAEALMRHERYAEAREELAGLLERVRGKVYPEAVVQQTWAYAEIGDGHYRAAAEHLQAALAPDVLPRKVAHPLRFTLAQLLVQEGRYRAALPVLEAWLAAESEPDAQAHVLAATLYGELKRYRQAIAHARDAIRAGAHQEPHYRLLLGLYLRAGRDRDAIRLLEREMLPRFAGRADLWKRLAALRMEREQWAKAVDTLTLARHKGLLAAADLEQLARLYLHLNDPLRSAALLQDPDLPATPVRLRLLADAWQQAREPQKAVRALEQAGSAEDRLRAGELLLELEQWQAAERHLAAAVDQGGGRSPGRARLLHGMALVRLERREAARAEFRRVTESEAPQGVRDQARQWLAWLDAES